MFWGPIGRLGRLFIGFGGSPLSGVGVFGYGGPVGTICRCMFLGLARKITSAPIASPMHKVHVGDDVLHYVTQ